MNYKEIDGINKHSPLVMVLLKSFVLNLRRNLIKDVIEELWPVSLVFLQFYHSKDLVYIGCGYGIAFIMEKLQQANQGKTFGWWKWIYHLWNLRC